MKNLKKLYIRITIAAAIIGVVLGIILKSIQIRNALAQPTQVVAPKATPMQKKTIYTLTLSEEEIVSGKK
jgi:hypothetical protein